MFLLTMVLNSFLDDENTIRDIRDDSVKLVYEIKML